MRGSRLIRSIIACLLGVAAPVAAAAAAAPKKPAPPSDAVLTPLQQRQCEQSVDRALAWLASQQADDGSFPTVRPAQTGVSGLCLLAFLSRGHLPGQGRYGENITRAVRFLLASQADDGML